MSGIAVVGLNGCGKSAFAHALCKKIGFFEADVEDYWFPMQKTLRIAYLEYGTGDSDLSKLPYSVACSREEVTKNILEDIKNHPDFVISGVTPDFGRELLSKIDIVFVIETPDDERIKRVVRREEQRFGSRVMSGGDMYEQQKRFRKKIAALDIERVFSFVDKINCKKVKLDGTKSLDENTEIAIKESEELL